MKFLKDIFASNKQLWAALLGLALLMGWIYFNGGMDSMWDMGSEPGPIVDNGKHAKYDRPPQYKLKSSTDYRAVIATTKGSFTVDLYEKTAPRAVANFVALANDSFYNNTSIYRVVPGYLVQGGDPRGDGTGGPGFTLSEEWSPRKKFGPYVMGMDLSANGSQFFILPGKYTDDGKLDQKYTALGEVIEGQDVIDAIEQVDTGVTVDGVDYPEMPVRPIVVRNIEILRVAK